MCSSDLATITGDTVNLSSLALEQEGTFIKSTNVLLDGGASHHVYYSPSIPKGAVRREVELAHGTKTGYVKGSDITFIDKSVSEEQAKAPAIVSLGRLIQRGIKLEWTKTGASLVLPNKKKIKIPVRNNCPYANKQVLSIVKRLRKIEEKQRTIKSYYAQLYTALKVRLRTQGDLDEHRRQGHIEYSPDCPECKRGTAKQRAHHRAVTKEGGELSVDIGGPYPVGLPVSDQPNIAQHRYPKYLLAGAFIPFSQKEALDHYNDEVRDRRAMTLAGPVQLETFTKAKSQSLYFVELLADRSEAPAALRRMINRIENMHKRKAVYRVHADRAKELTGDRPKKFLEDNGVMVTSTAGYDSNANGRAERAVQFFQTKARTMLSSNIRSEKFQEKLRELWTFATVHAGEVHRREMLGEPRCKFEFGQLILSRIPQPSTKFHPRLHKVLFLGFAPNVTNGYWVMNKWDNIELTSNVTEDPEFDKADALMEPTPKEPDQQPPALHDHPYEDKELEAVMGPDGGGGWYWGARLEQTSGVWTTR